MSKPADETAAVPSQRHVLPPHGEMFYAREARRRIQEHARIRARESRVSPGSGGQLQPTNGLLQLVLMPARMRDLLPTPLPNLNIAQWDEPLLSVTSTTCAGRPSALRGELAWGTEGDPKRIGGHC
jgi:hypothetical protein